MHKKCDNRAERLKRDEIKKQREAHQQGQSVAEGDVVAETNEASSDQYVIEEAEKPTAQREQGRNADKGDVHAIDVALSDGLVGVEEISKQDDFESAKSNDVLLETISPKTPKSSISGSRISHGSASFSDVVNLCFHDYSLPPQKDEVPDEPARSDVLPPTPVCRSPDLSVLLREAKEKIDIFLPILWTSFLEDDGITCLLVSRARPRTTQRTVFFHHSGSVEIRVHDQIMSADSFVKNLTSVSLQPDLIDKFVDRAVSVISRVRAMEVCAGADSVEYADAWGDTDGGFTDRNPFLEARYVETFRSTSCDMLVSVRKWRCDKCRRLLQPLKRQVLLSQKENLHKFTPNLHLTEEQKLKKLKSQRQGLDAAKRTIRALHAKIETMVKNESVEVDHDLDADLTEMFQSCTISPAQEVFLQQQIKASQQNMKKSSMRWHPTMIRLALAIHLTSPAAYNLVRDTGMIKLPSSRTLFDYSHVKPVEEGIDRTVLESVAERMKGIKEYQKYHVLMADEMYISKNLVFQKSSGKMIGYTKLDEVDREVRAFNEYLDDPDNFKGPSEQISSRVLCYMIKSTAYSIKETVACYAVCNVSPAQMYLWTWHVIGALERNDIKVIAFVCDGSTINRAFIKLHRPRTQVKDGLVFDTVNKAAPERDLYFFSDVPHLLKTIRNCFYSSRAGKHKKAKRCMTKGGQKIVWDFIIKLYMEDKHRSLRKAYKLSPANVFPDAFSCMKVSYAAQIMSDSVATALEQKKYKGVAETVKFIREVNAWFDRLNGAHSGMGRKKRNPNLESYRSVEDPRFQQLHDFLTYLDEWKAEAYSLGEVTINETANTSILEDSGEFEPFEDVVEECTTKAEKRILSHQTLLGIEITTRSFVKCVKFLLGEGTDFINARVFSQDPLEQYFSKQRAGGGGSTNPNLARFLNKNRLIHVLGQLGIKCRKGNSSEVGDSHVKVTEEPLPKRKCVRKVNELLDGSD